MNRYDGFSMEMDLGYRKIQRTGRGSYSISLPKAWVKKVEIKKGSEVTFKIQKDFPKLLNI